MGVVLVFEPASNIHWMKDVVQFPNTLAQFAYGTNATLITRPNHKQEELEKHIQVVHLGTALQENFLKFEYSDFSRIITFNVWYLNGCRKAAELGELLILYPWYGDFFEGAKIFKLKRWLRFKKASVVLKSDGLFKQKSESKSDLKTKFRDFFKYFFIDRMICENQEIFLQMKINQGHLLNKLVFIPNCPLDIYHTTEFIAYKERPRNFLFVGRVSDIEKGADLLLATWLRIFLKVKAWKLQLVGPCSEDFKQQWKQKIDEADADFSVQWFPTASPQELLNYYNSARVVVCSSRKESGPIVLSEAVFSRCAFIGTAVGEIPDLLKGMPGLVEDVERLGEEMLLFASNDNLAMEQAKKLREKIGDRKWSEQVKKILK
jgi:glycosyltransferase involved in cell wall biosynthesis